MKEQPIYIVNELLNNESYTFDSLHNHLNNNPDDINELKKALSLDARTEHHYLIIKYIQKQPIENRKELFEEICKIYRKPFLTHRTSLSRVIIINQEVFLHIIKNRSRI